MPIFGLLTISAKSSERKALFKELKYVANTKTKRNKKEILYFFTKTSIQDYLGIVKTVPGSIRSGFAMLLAFAILSKVIGSP